MGYSFQLDRPRPLYLRQEAGTDRSPAQRHRPDGVSLFRLRYLHAGRNRNRADRHSVFRTGLMRTLLRIDRPGRSVRLGFRGATSPGI